MSIKLWKQSTGSVDAAIDLVTRLLPEANCYGVEKDPAGWNAYVSRNNVSEGHWLFEANGSTGASALLNALFNALRVLRTTGDTPKRFVMTYLRADFVTEFTEETAPDWLTSRNNIVGSTMDNRWFWEEHVLTLSIGDSVDTDFRRITRVG